MKLWILFIAALIISRKAEKLLDTLAIKFWKLAIVPAWEIIKPRPGGKLWAAVRVMKGN